MFVSLLLAHAQSFFRCVTPQLEVTHISLGECSSFYEICVCCDSLLVYNEDNFENHKDFSHL